MSEYKSKVVEIFKFTCVRCTRKATTVMKKRLQTMLCAKCRAQKVVKGQMDIFGNQAL